MVAPFKVKSVPIFNTSPWINENIRGLKRDCRKIERKWKGSRLEAHYLQMKESLLHFNQSVKVARDAYFSDLIDRNRNNPRALFSTVNKLVN